MSLSLLVDIGCLRGKPSETGCYVFTNHLVSAQWYAIPLGCSVVARSIRSWSKIHFVSDCCSPGSDWKYIHSQYYPLLSRYVTEQSVRIRYQCKLFMCLESFECQSFSSRLVPISSIWSTSHRGAAYLRMLSGWSPDTLFLKLVSNIASINSPNTSARSSSRWLA